MHASAHAQKIRTSSNMQKKSTSCLIIKAKGVQQMAHLKQQCFLSSTIYKIQGSFEKIMCIYFIGSVVKIVLYLHFLYTRNERLQQIKKKHG